jgi:hypothetical protein
VIQLLIFQGLMKNASYHDWLNHLYPGPMQSSAVDELGEFRREYVFTFLQNIDMTTRYVVFFKFFLGII